MKAFTRLIFACGCCLIFAVAVANDKEYFSTTLRHNAPITENTAAPDYSTQEQSPTRRVRAFPMQPPTIPHAIEGMLITRDMNQCLMCHNAQTAPQVKAPAVALSHYQDRNGEYLSDLSPRRYFCTMCHAPQSVKQPVVENTF